LFAPDEQTAEQPFPFTIRRDAQGKPLAEPLAHAFFKSLLNERTEALLNQFPLSTVRKENGVDKVTLTFKGKAKERIDRRMPMVAKLSADELTGLSADLIRMGRDAEAIGILAPKSRDRSPDYRHIANLVFAHANNGDWQAAYDRQDSLLLDVDPPTNVTGLTKDQLAWLLRLDREGIRRWLQIRRVIANKPTPEQAPGEDTQVYPLFEDAQKQPVKFVNDKGIYEPGKLAAAERAKLPPDAIAIVQQLALWSPGDSMLLWLLAELYAADGRLVDAADAFDQCTARALTKPKSLMEHRAAVRAAVERLPKPAPIELPTLVEPPMQPPQEKGLFAVVSREQFIVVISLFGLVVGLLAALQVRAILRRRR